VSNCTSDATAIKVPIEIPATESTNILEGLSTLSMVSTISVITGVNA
jgi:hypothetical protein